MLAACVTLTPIKATCGADDEAIVRNATWRRRPFRVNGELDDLADPVPGDERAQLV